MRANATQDAATNEDDAMIALGEQASDVFRARDGERFVAVRFWFGASADETRAIHERVSRASAVSHPMLAAVESCEERGNGVLRIVSEYVPGPTLEAWSRGGRMLPVASAVDLVRRLCGGVQSALAHGVAPIALNPRNLVVRRVDAAGELELDAKLLDLEVAGWMRPEPPPLEAAHFIAPEIMALVLDDPTSRETQEARAHVFACGALLYYLVTGALPFRSDDAASLLEAHHASSLIPPSVINASISVELEQVIMRALASDPNERYSDPSELSIELGSTAGPLQSDVRALTGAAASASWSSPETAEPTANPRDAAAPPARPRRRSRFRFWVSLAALTAGVVSYFAVSELTAAADRRFDAELQPRVIPLAVAPAPTSAADQDRHAEAPADTKPELPAAKPAPVLNAEVAKPRPAGGVVQNERAVSPKAPAPDAPTRAAQARSASVSAGHAEHSATTTSVEAIVRDSPPPAAALETPRAADQAIQPVIESRVYGLAVRGSLVKSSVGRAIERVLPHWKACYARALQRDPDPSGGALHVDMTIDEMGRARNPQVTSEDSPSLGDCVARASSKFASEAPDTGTVEVSFNVRFRHGVAQVPN